MSKYKRPKDQWMELRKELNLYGSVEPGVELVAVTMPIGKLEGFTVAQGIVRGSFPDDSYGPSIPWEEIEMLPALSASVSYGSTERIQDDHDRCVSLNKSLIHKGHLTPLESVQFNLHVKGLSKAAGAQLSRYRHSGHISASRRFRPAEPSFVYPMLDYIEHPETAQGIYKEYTKMYEHSQWLYNALREPSSNWSDDPKLPFFCKNEEDNWEESYTIHKEDARLVIPVASATERTMWINARSLRHVFQERLREDCEIELRRLVWMIWDLVQPLCPSFFEDIQRQIERDTMPYMTRCPACDKLVKVQEFCSECNVQIAVRGVVGSSFTFFEYPMPKQPTKPSSVATTGMCGCVGCRKIRECEDVENGIPCDECGYVPDIHPILR